MPRYDTAVLNGTVVVPYVGVLRCDVGIRAGCAYSQDGKPQAGMGVYERGPDGLLAAARLYDDIEAPVR